MIYSFSPTSFRLLKECRRCFWLQFNQKIRRPKSFFPTLPSGIDIALKKYFDKCMDGGKMPRELSGFESDVRLFSDKKLLENWRDFRKGLKWTDEHGNQLRGAIDNLLEKNGKLVVLDYKTTGYPVKEKNALFYQDQLDTYNFLLQKNGFLTENYAVLLYYFPEQIKDGKFLFGSTLLKVTVNPQNARKIFATALELLKNPCPQETCKWCDKIKEKIG